MSDDLVNIEVNGTALQARKGQMLIEVTDAHGVYVPRFCYHEKLSIAANCRMCLVEVEKAPKPMPACATPVTEGMKVFTRSARAIAAQKATMEFLLINHPLDCPICDQGGECELQDLAMGFGRDVSRYAERKRVVKDKNLGPLVSTDMTRCIHCTRCVRFTQEIAGYQELGTVGRGESTEIGTFIERSVDHELSANIIDLCPVGALNNKPYRYLARAWEMTQHPLVSPHDCVGTNIYAHVLQGRVMRVVPRSNDAINESWIADRDRFSCDGLYGPDRIGRPLVREAGIWREQDWEPALALVAERLGRIVKQHGARELGALAAPSSTLEELYLLARILRALGSNNLDYRLRRTDFRDEQHDPLQPTLGCSIVELEQAQTILVIGSNLRKDVPILAHRVRKAAIRNDARISCISPQSYDYRFPTLQLDARDGTSMAAHLAAILRAALERAAKDVPTRVAGAVAQAVVKKWHREIAAQLGEGDRRLILLGAIAMRDPAYSDLRAIAAVLAGTTGATLGHIPEGGNAVGAELAGVLPHRAAGGARVTSAGLNVADMLAARLKAYVLFGGIEPAEDLAAPQALEALREAEFVVALSPFGAARDHAHVILPIATHFETSGTYVNAEGRWQSVPGAAQPVGETRPGWKVLRVLGNLLDLPGFDYVDSLQVRDELAEFLDTANVPTAAPGGHEVLSLPRGPAGREVPIYRVDALVRRAAALQHTRDGIEAREPLELTA